jgi:hypothetical protein
VTGSAARQRNFGVVRVEYPAEGGAEVQFDVYDESGGRLGHVGKEPVRVSER